MDTKSFLLIKILLLSLRKETLPESIQLHDQMKSEIVYFQNQPRKEILPFPSET